MNNILSNKYFLGAAVILIAGIAYFGYHANDTNTSTESTASVEGTNTQVTTVSNSVTPAKTKSVEGTAVKAEPVEGTTTQD